MNKQLRFKNTLFAAKGALEEAGTRFFLSSGTALGAWREGEFIEYTHDIDLGVYETDFNPKVKEMLSTRGFTLTAEHGTLHDGYQLTITNKEFDVPLDIFLYYEEDEYVWYATHSRLCQCMIRGFCRWKFKKFDLKPMNFLDEEFFIPHPTEQYLINKYGISWKTPQDFTYRQGILGRYKNRINEFSLINTIRMLKKQIQTL